jgi:hypothetical protein
MIYQKLCNTTDPKEALFDICIPCWDKSQKLNETIGNIIDSEYKVTLPCKFIISIEKQSVVKNRLDCLKHSESPLVLWLDDDIAFQQKGWDKHLYDSIVADEKMGVIGVNVVHYRAPTTAPSRPHGLVPDLCGAVMMTRKINGVQFDENYVKSQIEDTDYCWQVRKAGYKVFQDNRVWVRHYNEEVNRDYTNNGPYFNKKWNVSMFR